MFPLISVALLFLFFSFFHFFYQERCQYHSIYYTDDKVTNRFFRESHDNEI